ncbi:protein MICRORCHIDIA 7-like [Salvia miltiorrhiza]|uniref:protein MICRORCHIDIA 7-like n=1 Tax=Salvia miltiorrhiza TaxID=226208 RepID=UPI0025ACAEFC|nr:protein MICRORCHIDIA 7-like [Salvia miltiorrhiza]
MDAYIKQETLEPERRQVISLSSSSSSGGSDSDSDVELNPNKKRRMEALLPVGFLDPIRPPPVHGYESVVRVKQENVIEKEKHVTEVAPVTAVAPVTTVAVMSSCKQFWKAGDYEGCANGANLYDEEMDHVRVHPKFLHSNATSHKWALGAFAELLDNALDEYCNGATYVDVDMVENRKDKTKMVVVQDNGGGMTPEKMRQCMSLGYSAKSKISSTIGQYGNGFKTSTMRLGADVIVFSRCQGKYGRSSMQSIGLLSYTFLRGTGKEDIVVPMIDYERNGEAWSQHVKSSSDSWHRNLETIVEWSPYETEGDLLQQFDFLSEQGTRIVIYNLWDDDLGSPELDFETDQHDIQLRGDERNEKKIKMANTYSSSAHFLTYRHSLRSYASILYRSLPRGFRIILRGKEVDHHDIVSDLMNSERHVYRPAPRPDVPASKDPNMSATVTLGFVKDAHHHIDIQGFNVYHKNRLIKPFWRVWNAAGSDGRGVIGVLEANFIEPAHDKQGFERTVALSRLENRLVHFQKTYWSTNCQVIGYAPRRHPKNSVSPDKTASSSVEVEQSSAKTKRTPPAREEYRSSANRVGVSQPKSSPHVKSNEDEAASASSSSMLFQLRQENEGLRESLKIMLEERQSLKNELEDTKKKMFTMDKEQEMFVATFAEERGRRQEEEDNLRRRLKDACETIQALLKKVKILEAGRS